MSQQDRKYIKKTLIFLCIFFAELENKRIFALAITNDSNLVK